MPKVISRRLIYHGAVQGVGFRATAQSLARGFPVEGYVRNRADGTVELAVRGEHSEVEHFLAAISAHSSENISKMGEETISQDITEKGLAIRY